MSLKQGITQLAGVSEEDGSGTPVSRNMNMRLIED